MLQVNSFVGAFHDAVILYALALNDTLTEGEDPRNGTAVTRRMWNRTFTGRAYSLITHSFIRKHRTLVSPPALREAQARRATRFADVFNTYF